MDKRGVQSEVCKTGLVGTESVIGFGLDIGDLDGRGGEHRKVTRGGSKFKETVTSVCTDNVILTITESSMVCSQ
jgi:hypothetical protein